MTCAADWVSDMHTLRWTPKSVEDLENIKKFIEEDDPEAAADVLLSILDKAEQLREFPLSGPALPEKRHENDTMRYLLAERYVVFYRPDGEVVSIIRVLRARQDMLRLLREV